MFPQATHFFICRNCGYEETLTQEAFESRKLGEKRKCPDCGSDKTESGPIKNTGPESEEVEKMKQY